MTWGTPYLTNGHSASAGYRNALGKSAARARFDSSILAAILFGVGFGFDIPLVGTLYASEALAIMALPFIAPFALLAKYRALIPLLFCYGLMLAGFVLADVLNESAPADFLRAWASIVAGAVSLFFVVWFLDKRPGNIIWLLLALAAGYLIRIGTIDLDTVTATANAFKATLVPSLFFVAIVIAALVSKLSRAVALGWVLATGTLVLLLGARSIGVILVISAFVLFVAQTGRPGSLSKYLVALPFGLCAAYLGYVAYVEYTLNSTIVTNSSFQLSRAENPYNPFELLYYGRSDLFVAWQAILEKPIFGHGSWARDTSGFYSELHWRITGVLSGIYWPFIRSHSVVLTAWLWGGVLSFMGALLLLGLFLDRFIRALMTRSPLLPMVVILGIYFLWHYFFSPFGHIRLTFPVVLGLLIAYVAKARVPARPAPPVTRASANYAADTL